MIKIDNKKDSFYQLTINFLTCGIKGKIKFRLQEINEKWEMKEKKTM